MMTSLKDMTVVNGFPLSILVSRIDGVSHIDNGSHDAKVENDECYIRNMDVDYDKRNVVKIQEPYLPLSEVKFSLLP